MALPLHVLRNRLKVHDGDRGEGGMEGRGDGRKKGTLSDAGGSCLAPEGLRSCLMRHGGGLGNYILGKLTGLMRDMRSKLL